MIRIFGWFYSFTKVVLSDLLSPVTLLWEFVTSLCGVTVDLITPIVTLFTELLRLILSLIKLVLYAPSIGLLKLLLLIKDGAVGIFGLIKSTFILFKSFLPMANRQNREATMSFLQVC